MNLNDLINEINSKNKGLPYRRLPLQRYVNNRIRFN